MNITDPSLHLLEQSFRWFGPNDSVPLSYIRQAGAEAVFTSLHEFAYGDLWPREAIRERKELLERNGLRWAAVESVPVHEDIKTGNGNLTHLFENYRNTLRNLGAEGVDVVSSTISCPCSTRSARTRSDPGRRLGVPAI